MDADWATDASDRKSVSGFLFFFQGSLISWSATKQKTVALSSTEAEYMAIAHAMREALWLRLLFHFIHLPFASPFPFFSDNVGAIDLSNSEATSACSKHIDVCYHFLQHHVSDGSFSPRWIQTGDMVADLLTKPLPIPTHHRHCLNLGLDPSSDSSATYPPVLSALSMTTSSSVLG